MDAPVTLSQRTYKGWSAWLITRGSLELILVPQIGGRIMGARWRGRDIFFTHPGLEGRVPELPTSGAVAAQRASLGFPLWGGDKTWLAPQATWREAVPFIDLDSGPYETRVLCHGPETVQIAMTSRICRDTAIQLTRVVTVSAAHVGWTVTHSIENTGPLPARWGIWDVAMVTRPATVFLPRRADSHHPDGLKTFDAEGQSLQVRDEVVTTTEGLAVVQCQQPWAFKYGADAHEGWIMAVIDPGDAPLIGYAKEIPAAPGEIRAHDCTAEVYNSDTLPYLELELHGPLGTLEPGQQQRMIERQWIGDIAHTPGSYAEITDWLNRQKQT